MLECYLTLMHPDFSDSTEVITVGLSSLEARR